MPRRRSSPAARAHAAALAAERQAKGWPWKAEKPAPVPSGPGVPGRPTGSANKRTLQLARYLAALGFKDPALGLAHVASMDWGALAKALSCTPLEAARFWLDCSDKLMPYIHQKRPIALEHEAPDAGDMTQRQLAEAIIKGATEILRNQALIDVTDSVVGTDAVGTTKGKADE